ncbi:hypothetical protein WICMUC_002469 [Wickerhamomyces mucosus]|uniref:Luciferase-like domain-containing protein n=1 Tax=Wickerhamomyces mucosus TaxID=1378264 RepID=A0A9P8PP45_9ASCO|nr:hypothetical protein WICMUC_002469 [Wickerhamomyces mucosus]
MTQESSRKRQKIENVKEPWIINFFQCVTPVLHAPGQWKNPRDQSRDYFKPEYWVKIAKLAEKGKLHGIFFGDNLGYYGGYKSKGLDGPFNFQEGAKSGNNFPKNDPTAYLSAMAISTKNLSFGFTCSTLSEHPYHFARRMATLDHISNGRVGWNVVTTITPTSGRQLSKDNKMPEKDQRYFKTDEYLQVFYELLLSSWRDDGVVFDRENGIFSNPDAIREINYVGDYFKVPGPQITEPTKGRIPLIIQAGSSKYGQLLGAKHGELIFVANRAPEEVNKLITEHKRIAKEIYGRDPTKIKFVTQAAVILGKTDEEAQAKFQELLSYVDYEGIYTQSGAAGLDLSKFKDDEDLTKVDDVLAKGFAIGYSQQFPGEIITKKFIAENYHKKITDYVGTPEKIADELEDYINKSGIDGFNFTNLVFPENFEDIIELLIPELQKRGLAQREYAVEGGTYRENVYRQKGHTFVPEDHYAYKYRWKAGETKEQFEKRLVELKKEHATLRIVPENK